MKMKKKSVCVGNTMVNRLTCPNGIDNTSLRATLVSLFKEREVKFSEE